MLVLAVAGYASVLAIYLDATAIREAGGNWQPSVLAYAVGSVLVSPSFRPSSTSFIGTDTSASPEIGYPGAGHRWGIADDASRVAAGRLEAHRIGIVSAHDPKYIKILYIPGGFEPRRLESSVCWARTAEDTCASRVCSAQSSPGRIRTAVLSSLP